MTIWVNAKKKKHSPNYQYKDGAVHLLKYMTTKTKECGRKYPKIVKKKFIGSKIIKTIYTHNDWRNKK